MNQGFWRGLGGGGDHFWLHRETLNFKGPAAYQNTVVFQIGVNIKFLQTSTHYVTPLWVIWLLNGSLHDPFMGRSASEG